MTDAGIIEGLLVNSRGQGPTPKETTAFKESFFQKLEREFASNPDSFAPVPGALETISAIRCDPQWAMAIATGGWEGSALFKLRCAGIGLEGVALATSDDAVARTGIVAKALERAARINPGNEFERIVSVGDGSWDVRAARDLGLAFVGIGSRERLTGSGARHIRPDLRNSKEFLKLLSRAIPPARASNRG